METVAKNFGLEKSGFINHLLKEGWTYIKTIVDIDVMQEPILILDKDLRIMAVNESFYKIFQVEAKDTENKFFYEIGNSQWNIPTLKRLLEDIIPQDTFIKGLEIVRDFPLIGRKIMILSARQIYFKENVSLKLFPPLIFLTIEDVTEMMIIAEKMALQASNLETRITKKTKKLETYIKKLEKEINIIKNKSL